MATVQVPVGGGQAPARTRPAGGPGFRLQPLNDSNESPLFRRRAEKLMEEATGAVDR